MVRYLKVLLISLSVIMLTGCFVRFDNIKDNSSYYEGEVNPANRDREIEKFLGNNYYYMQYNIKRSKFYPLSYENGVVKGIVSPFTLNELNESPILFKEYESRDKVFRETGNLIDIDNKIKIKVEDYDNKLFIKDKDSEKLYDIKIQDNIDINFDKIQNENQINEEFNSFILLNKEENVGTIYINVAKITDRYTAISLNVAYGDVYKEFQLIFDYQEKNIYKTNTYNLQDMNKAWSDEVSGKFIMCGEKIYRIDYLTGKLQEVILKDTSLILKEIHDFDFDKDDGSQWLSFLGTNKNTIFIAKNINLGSSQDIPSTIYTINSSNNKVEKSQIDTKNKGYIEKVFENSHNLILVNEKATSNNIERWIAKYENGSYYKLKKIEVVKSTNGATPYRVEDILYDNYTNSFLLVRSVDREKNRIIYNYEYLYLE